MSGCLQLLIKTKTNKEKEKEKTGRNAGLESQLYCSESLTHRGQCLGAIYKSGREIVNLGVNKLSENIL